MLKFFLLLLCLSVTLGVGYSATTPAPAPQGTNATTPKTNGTTTLKPTNGSTTATPTNGSTTATPTNVSTTATPTNGSTTATPTNGSTTATPTNGSSTATPTNGSSTVKPTPTTTPKPTPPPGNFSLYNNQTDKYCLLAEFAATFKISYLANVSKVNSSSILERKTATIYLDRTNSDDVKIDGDCGLKKPEAELKLSWPKNTYYILKMEFNKEAKALEANAKSSKWTVKMITLNVTLKGNPDFPDATEKSVMSFYNSSSAPSGEVGGYYGCKSKERWTFKNPTAANYSVEADFRDMKLEPFVSKNTTDDFGTDVNQCPQDNPHTPSKEPPGNNDIVPIAVGCALAGLVLIVLIAYIIGRRKSHRGYEKV